MYHLSFLFAVWSVLTCIILSEISGQTEPSSNLSDIAKYKTNKSGKSKTNKSSKKLMKKNKSSKLTTSDDTWKRSTESPTKSKAIVPSKAPVSRSKKTSTSSPTAKVGPSPSTPETDESSPHSVSKIQSISSHSRPVRYSYLSFVVSSLILYVIAH